MNIAEQIATLEKLALLDAELRTVDAEIAADRTTLDQLTGGLKKVQDSLRVEREAVTRVEKSRNELVADIRAMSLQLDHSRDKLNRSRTEREANAAQRETEELRKLVRDREDDVERANQEIGAKRTVMDQQEAEEKRLTDELGANAGSIQSKLGEATGLREKLAGEREVLVKQVEAQLYRRYEMVRVKRGSGLAQTTTGTCKACNMSLPPQLFGRLRREPLLEQCPSCQRLIYFAPPMVEKVSSPA